MKQAESLVKIMTSKKISFGVFIFLHEQAAIFAFLLTVKLFFLDNLSGQYFAELYMARSSLELKIFIFLYFNLHFLSFIVLRHIAFKFNERSFAALFIWLNIVACILISCSIFGGNGVILEIGLLDFMFYCGQYYLLSYYILNLTKNDGTLQLNTSPSTMNKVLGAAFILGSVFFSYILWG